MSLNKKISILILLIGLAVIGWIAWDKFLNKGIIAINGPAPFNVKIDGATFPCTTEMCETKFAAGEYDLLIQKDGYVDISQKITLRRAEKLIINAELKKKISFNEVGPQQAKYVKLLGIELPLEISTSDGLRQEYDKLFEIVRNIKSPKSIILRKMNSGTSLAAIVYTSDNDRTYFAASDQKKLVNFSKRLNGPAAIVPTAKPAVVFLDNKSYKNQALMIWNIGSSAPAVVTYFQIPISGEIITVSDNGKFIFALDKEVGGSTIYKIDLEKKSKENIAQSLGEITRIMPSSDGKFVLYDSFGTIEEYIIVDTESRLSRPIEPKKYWLAYLSAWTSDNKIVFVYQETETVMGALGESSTRMFPRVVEYNPSDASTRVIQDLKEAAAMPSKMDYVEAGEYKRVTMLIENKIYNLDYLAK
ncbi:PEGA domain-containing protein [Candidatus Peregrinibacteria bacterium]|nr:PEGA domain-containing protein [Candidatus Peregrinibacteria bacterium]